MSSKMICLLLSVMMALTTGVSGRTLSQLAGAGAGCDSIFTQTDNASGYGTENAEDNVAGDMNSAKGRRLHQNAGTGSGCNSILTQTDNSVGYGVENAEDGIASDINPNVKPNPGMPTGRKLQEAAGALLGRSLKQLDKIANGFGNIGRAAGVQGETDTVVQIGDSADGDLTGDLASEGAQVGQLEDDTIIPAGKLVPGRKLLMSSGAGRSLTQLDKIANGFGNIGRAAGVQGESDTVVQIGDSADGDLTGDLAADGAQVGQLEDDTIIPAGKLVPGK